MNAEFHFRRAFTQGDRNYEARFWYARQAYVNGKLEEARDLFRELRLAPLDPEFKRQVRGVIESEGKPQSFTGSINQLQPDYAFIRRDGQGDDAFIRISSANPVVWERLSRSTRVHFHLGFTFFGPAAVELGLE
ncbi:MAG: hypothetical protein EXR53_03660 [Dehalococcoidia bacterium]|nr:hypothetical protein [Dehalococcoidia bacterium]